MASPAVAPSVNGDSRFLSGLVKYWPILGGLVLVVASYFSLAGQTAQNSRDIEALKQNTATHDQLDNVKDSLKRIERNQEVLDGKFDQVLARSASKR